MDRIVAERAEQQVEPHHVGIELAEFGEQAKSAVGTVGRPAAYHRKAMELRNRGRDFVAENRELDKRIPLEFLGDMKAIFTQTAMTGRKRGYQANSHSASRVTSAWMRPPDRMLAWFARSGVSPSAANLYL